MERQEDDGATADGGEFYADTDFEQFKDLGHDLGHNLDGMAGEILALNALLVSSLSRSPTR